MECGSHGSITAGYIKYYNQNVIIRQKKDSFNLNIILKSSVLEFEFRIIYERESFKFNFIHPLFQFKKKRFENFA